MVRLIFTVVAFIAWLSGVRWGFQREIKRILLIRVDLLGDVILTMPAVAALRRQYPEARFTMLVLPYTAPVLELFPYVESVLTFDINKLRPSGDLLNISHYRNLWRLVWRLRRERYDLAVSFYGLYAGILSFLSGAPLRVGYRSEGCPFLFSVPVPGRRYHAAQHEVEYNLALARAAGAFTSPPGPAPAASGVIARPGFDTPTAPWSPQAEAISRSHGEGVAGEVTLAPRVPNAAWERVLGLLEREGVGPRDLLVAIHPGSTNGEAKRWNAAGWAGLADRLASDLGAGVVVTGVASEMPLVQEITGRMKTRPVVMAGRTSVPELAGLLARCRVLVSGDSAPLHLAWALGVPVVGLYGPTDPAVCGPYGRSIVVRKGLSCSPCYSLQDIPECKRESEACMEAITGEEVFGAVESAMRESPSAAPSGSGQALAGPTDVEGVLRGGS